MFFKIQSFAVCFLASWLGNNSILYLKVLFLAFLCFSFLGLVSGENMFFLGLVSGYFQLCVGVVYQDLIKISDDKKKKK